MEERFVREIPPRTPLLVAVVGEAGRKPISFWKQLWQGPRALTVRITVPVASVALTVGSPLEKARSIK